MILNCFPGDILVCRRHLLEYLDGRKYELFSHQHFQHQMYEQLKQIVNFLLNKKIQILSLEKSNETLKHACGQCLLTFFYERVKRQAINFFNFYELTFVLHFHSNIHDEFTHMYFTNNNIYIQIKRIT